MRQVTRQFAAAAGQANPGQQLVCLFAQFGIRTACTQDLVTRLAEILLQFQKLMTRRRKSQRQMKKQAAVQKRKFLLNAKALEIVLQNEEKKRDAIAEEITNLQDSSAGQTL